MMISHEVEFDGVCSECKRRMKKVYLWEKQFITCQKYLMTRKILKRSDRYLSVLGENGVDSVLHSLAEAGVKKLVLSIL